MPFMGISSEAQQNYQPQSLLFAEAKQGAKLWMCLWEIEFAPSGDS